jgi:hypothetical protein
VRVSRLDQEPLVVFSVFPSCAVPEITGRLVLAGGGLAANAAIAATANAALKTMVATSIRHATLALPRSRLIRTPISSAPNALVSSEL